MAVVVVVATDAPPTNSTIMHASSDLTIIVAATARSMGIGLNGCLPWTLKKDMAYFARVTKRVPPPLPSSSAPAPPPSTSSATATPPQNTVIMGRKTWESIPPHLRPLAHRHNIIVSRTLPPSPPPPPPPTTDNEATPPPYRVTPSLSSACAGPHPARAFVIGGADIYRQVLARADCTRILLTRVLTDFETDVSFPVALDPTAPALAGAWTRREKRELDAFVGEVTPEGVQVAEDGTRYVFEMWEREPPPGM